MEELDGPQVLQRLEHFIDAVVQLHPERPSDRALAERLDALERVIELLRLKTGKLRNDISMESLLERGISASRDGDGSWSLKIGGHESPRMTVGWPSWKERHQTELQRPLVLFLLHFHRTGGKIDELIARFVHALRTQLSPRDVERTRTGVTRVETTTRFAAQALRNFGLLTESPRTAYKTWELSVLGLIVAAELHTRTRRLEVPSRERPRVGWRTMPASDDLDRELADVTRRYREATRVKEALLRLCGPDRHVFDTFDLVVQAIAAHCTRLDDMWRADEGQRKRSKDAAAIRREADEMLMAVEASVAPGLFTEDLRRKFALDELLGSLNG